MLLTLRFMIWIRASLFFSLSWHLSPCMVFLTIDKAAFSLLILLLLQYGRASPWPTDPKMTISTKTKAGATSCPAPVDIYFCFVWFLWMCSTLSSTVCFAASQHTSWPFSRLWRDFCIRCLKTQRHAWNVRCDFSPLFFRKDSRGLAVITSNSCRMYTIISLHTN